MMPTVLMESASALVEELRRVNASFGRFKGDPCASSWAFSVDSLGDDRTGVSQASELSGGGWMALGSMPGPSRGSQGELLDAAVT